jgi:hypothetical protein
MGRPRRQPTPDVQEPEVRVQWVRAEPTPLQARAWRRLWELLLQGDPAALAPDEPPSIVADETGTRKHADDRA